ncbi:hypothetical protein DNTS_025182 [Danionella cerebrum]|uniref:Receptor-type tyrosine-protein phosphatase-like N n=1 Tax=Danionella cerebrum TaxID=2873325 RepID=A0A553QXZ9_9TELE|nr:hypothetical protein DNTS_025182 [Danionella translucida]
MSQWDKIFGQCRSSRLDQVQYQVSVPVLQRLQEVLKELMRQAGFSWKDDITQHIIAKELSRVPITRSQKPQNSQSPPPAAKKVHSTSNSEPAPAQSYMDYMVLDPHQSSSLRMQTLPMDPYSYLQEDMSQSLHPHSSMGYQRPSSRARSQQRARDRQLLEDAVSLYLSSMQPSFRHRGAATLPAAPYYEDLDFPMEYGEEYNLPEQPGSQQRSSKKLPQEHSTLAGLSDDNLAQLGSLLRGFGVDPRDLSPQQLERLTLVLQMLQKTDNADRSAGVVPVKETNVEGIDEVTQNGAKAPAALPSPTVPQQPPSSPRNQALSSVFPLSLYDGVKLLETLAEKIHLSTSSFINISVVGSALTFRIRQNSLNLSAEDVANKAVAEKNYLEGETGLKIIQTGVGEVGTSLSLHLMQPIPLTAGTSGSD